MKMKKNRFKVDFLNAKVCVESRSLLVAVFVLLVVIGFPRIYATEVPMAILLVPFYLMGFLRFQAKNLFFSLVFVTLFSCWLLGGVVAFLMGDGTTKDLAFHFIVSAKILLNVFFGYVVYVVVREQSAALLLWLLVQLLIICASMLSADIYSFLLGFISPRSADVFQHIFGLRAIGFGLFHVGGALTVVTATFYYLLIVQNSFSRMLLLLLILPISMAVARSAIIPYLVLGVLKQGVKSKIYLAISMLVMCVLSVLVNSGPLYEATEIFRNFLSRGSFHSASVDALASMYVLPDSLKVYVLGVGQYFDSGVSGLRYYMGTDVGYLRLLYYSGVGSVFVFMALNIFGLVGLMISHRYPGSYNIRAFALALVCIFLVVNFKGLQVMPIFGFVFYFYASAQKSNTCLQGD